MQTGTCALCGQIGKLHESHFLPKGVYKLLRDSNNGNNNPVLISKKISAQKSFQMKQPLLCSSCERRFSENGEKYVLPLLSKRTAFPLLDRLKLAQPLDVTPDTAAFTCPSVGFDGEKLGYFGLSILWRAAVRPWRTFDNDTTSVQLDAKYMESMRRYLAGESGFPNDVAVIAVVATDFVSRQSCFVPHRITDNPFHVAYGLLIKGLFFRFIVGDDNPPAMRAMSCAGPGLNMIFVKDCSDKSWIPFARMMETTVPKGQLADFRLDETSSGVKLNPRPPASSVDP
jgi:hypothetical protein